MQDIQLPECISCQSVSDKFSENKNDSKRNDMEHDLMNNVVKATGGMKVTLEFPEKSDNGSEPTDSDLKDVKQILLKMLETYVRKIS